MFPVLAACLKKAPRCFCLLCLMMASVSCSFCWFLMLSFNVLARVCISGAGITCKVDSRFSSDVSENERSNVMG